MLPWLRIFSCLVLVGCSSDERPSSSPHQHGWARYMEDREISRFLETAINDLSKGDDETWNRISKVWRANKLDGIGATCFLVGLGELFARSPTIFLERYLAGDETAKELAREAYGLLYAEHIVNKPSFNVETVRVNALRMYRQRQAMADEVTQAKIEHFILFLTTPRHP